MSAYAQAVRTPTGAWEVFCTDCRTSIGTMDGITLLRAIMTTKDRGGVKCPECRTKSCRMCYRHQSKCDGLDENNFCGFCLWEMATVEDVEAKEAFVEVTLV